MKDKDIMSILNETWDMDIFEVLYPYYRQLLNIALKKRNILYENWVLRGSATSKNCGTLLPIRWFNYCSAEELQNIFCRATGSQRSPGCAPCSSVAAWQLGCGPGCIPAARLWLCLWPWLWPSITSEMLRKVMDSTVERAYSYLNSNFGHLKYTARNMWIKLYDLIFRLKLIHVFIFLSFFVNNAYKWCLIFASPFTV